MIIDAPPTMSLLNTNVLNAAPALELVVPLDPGIYSSVGVGKLQEVVSQVKRHLLNPELAIVALVIVRIQKHKAHADFDANLESSTGRSSARRRYPTRFLCRSLVRTI